MGNPQRDLQDFSSRLTNKTLSAAGRLTKRFLLGTGGSIEASGKHLIQRLAQQVVKQLIKMIFRAFLKLFLSVFGSTVGLLFFGIIIFTIVFTSLFIQLDSDLDGLEDLQGRENYQKFVQMASTTVDPDKPEQTFFRIHEDLLMIATGIGIQNKLSTEDEIFSTIIRYTKPTFTYQEMEEWYETYTKTKDCEVDSEGNKHCEWETHPVMKTMVPVAKLITAKTFNGEWAISYKEEISDWKLVEQESDKKVYRRDMKFIEDRKWITQSDTSNLLAALKELGFGELDLSLLQSFYNQKASNLFDIYFNGIGSLGLNDGIDGYGDRVNPSQPIDPALLQTEWFWPVPDIHNITSGFGERIHPLTGKKQGHSGIDIAGGASTAGTIVYAPRDGTVIKAGTSNGYGIAVFIDHTDVKLISELGHLQYNQILVKEGDHVKKGDPVATIGYGQVGDSSGPHLHLTIEDYKGKHYNPILLPGLQP